MKILFSGAQNFKLEQNDVNKSLGGFMSSTSVPNKKLNSIFSDVSNFDLKNKSQNVLGFFIYNDTNANLLNLSLETFYQNKFDKLINLCDFEFSVTEVSENGAIESIGSIYEEPFYANWFDCESRYENCIVKLLTPGNIGDDFSIFGLLGVLSGDTLDSLKQDIIDLLSLNNFNCESVDDSSIFIERDNTLVSGDGSDFYCSGLATIEDSNLKNGKDGKTLLYSSLLPDKSIGIWMKRKINNNYKLLNTDCQDLSVVDLETIEAVRMVFEID